MLKGGISEPRNKAIMKMFNLIRIGERAGSGVPDIFTTWDNEGWIAPEVEEQYKPDRTILKLSFVNKEISPDFQKSGEKSGEKSGDDTERISIELSKSDEMEKRQQMIMEIMKENPSISAKDIALKMNITRGQVEKSISDMKKTGKIQRSGSARNGQWHIL